MVLTKNERDVVKRFSFFKKFGVATMIFGLLRMVAGEHSHISRPMSPDARRLTITLHFLSVGFLICGWHLRQAYGIIEKLASEGDD